MTEMKQITLDARNLHYKVLNDKIRKYVRGGYKKIAVKNVYGQRYIGDGLTQKDVTIEVFGVPGDDMAAFMDGATIIVRGNVQNGCGNTMNSGEIVVFGSAGDILGHSMRGGRIFVRGSVGYRIGIHMKAYGKTFPTVVIGGSAGAFLGEYMAGGIIVLLGLDGSRNIVGSFTGAGMHGGAIFVRGKVDIGLLDRGIKLAEPTAQDLKVLRKKVSDFCGYFGGDVAKIFKNKFVKLFPHSSRPYGKIYAY